MMIDAIKRRWHRDLVAHPVTHAWVLNLYRAGERHPQTVTDYFPAHAAPDGELRDLLLRHQGDERRHERMYATAIARLGEPIVELAGTNVFNQVIRDLTPASFAVAAGDPLDTRRAAVAHFLAHAHFLEKRITRSLEYHLAACEDAHAHMPAAVVAAVLADEERHAQYTREWVFELLSRRDAEGVLALHRRAEARANLRFSGLQVRRHLETHGRDARMDRRLVYQFCAWIMEGLVNHV